MKRNILLLSLMLSCHVPLVLAAWSTSIQDSLALVAFYNETQGDEWQRNDSWLVGEVSTWYGVQVNSGRVIALNLSSNGLTGDLPVELGALNKLQYIYISYNQLTGSLPDALINLTALKVFWAPHNGFSGRLSSSIGGMDSLKTLNLSYNSFEGVIPNAIGNLSELENINLQHNRFSGAIPDTIGHLKHLKYFYLNDCKFSGSLPSTITNLTNLCFLTLENNYIQNIPDLSTLNALGLDDGLVHLSIQNNYLDFHDVVPNLALFSQVSQYSPQRTFSTGPDVLIRPGDSLQFNMPQQTVINGNDSLTTYLYKRNGYVVQNDSSKVFVINSASASHLGNYICYASRQDVPGLTLVMSSVKLICDPDSSWLSISTILNGVPVDTVAYDIELYESVESEFVKTVVCSSIEGRCSELLIAPGKYYFKLKPHDSKFMPRYCSNNYLWSSKTIYNAPAGGSLVFSTSLESQKEYTGMGRISGQLSWAKEGDVSEPFSIVEGASVSPFVGADIFLFNVEENVADYHVRTQGDGLFGFEGLVNGSYELRIDFPGYTQAIYNTMMIKDGQYYFDNINYSMVDSVSLVSGQQASFAAADLVQVYPNPSQGIIFVEGEFVNNKMLDVSLFDLTGKRIIKTELFSAASLVTLNLTDLSEHALRPGMYLLEMNNGAQRVTNRVIVK